MVPTPCDFTRCSRTYQQSKPWDSNGIDGCFRFLRKLWNLFYKDEQFLPTDVTPTKDNLKTLHKLIKKVTEDIEVFSYNTSVPAFMIAVGELAQQKCNSKEVLQTSWCYSLPSLLTWQKNCGTRWATPPQCAMLHGLSLMRRTSRKTP